MHKDDNETLSTDRKKHIARHNVKTPIGPCNIAVGDYVVAEHFHRLRIKMSANWIGPRRVVEILSDFTLKS